MAKKLYHHKTDGGAEYLCLKEDDLSTAVVRLDGHPEMIRGDENAAFSELLDALRQIEGMCNMPEVKRAMMKHEQAYYHSVMRAVREAISAAEG